MKLIDDKGRFLGKINIIDLLVLLVVLVVGVFLVIKLSGGGGDGVSGDGVSGDTKITYTVQVRDVDVEVYNAIQEYIPGRLMASGNFLDGEVTQVTEEPSKGQIHTITPSNEGGMELDSRAKDTYDLTFTIEARVANSMKNEIGTQEIRIGKSHIIKTDKFELEKGTILSCEWEKAS